MTIASELRELSQDELLDRLEESKAELFNLRFQQTSGQLEDSSQLKRTRRDIARILTVIREKELEAENAE